MQQPIDAVISWVDGYDPIYQQKLAAFCRQVGVKQHQVIEPTRIQQCNEIYYCLHSLRRFAPWLRHIYIITNEQTPPVVAELQDNPFAKKIKIIDQNELLRAQGIQTPIFNSLSAEWLMWLIPGLSNQFLYLNDDFFIIRDVKPEDFFDEERLVLCGEWKVQSEQKWSYRLNKVIRSNLGLSLPKAKTNPHRHWQESSARLAGCKKRFYLLPHAPFPLFKDTFEAQMAKHPKMLLDNASFPFRDLKQVSSVPLIVHQDILAKRVVYRSKRAAITVHGSAHTPQKIRAKLKRAKCDPRVAFVCMQSMDEAPIELQHELKNWLTEQVIKP